MLILFKIVIMLILTTIYMCNMREKIQYLDFVAYATFKREVLGYNISTPFGMVIVTSGFFVF